MALRTLTQERRRFTRSAVSPHLAINLLEPHASSISSVNCSEGGLCLRLQEALEVRSLVRLQVASERANAGRTFRPMECTARVAWVIQRLDLRGSPPFLYDVGIEFVDPPALLRQVMAHRGIQLGALRKPSVQRPLEPATVRGRQFIPRLERDMGRPSRWHLVVSIDGAPCFSNRYTSERLALNAWAHFKRQQSKR